VLKHQEYAGAGLLAELAKFGRKLCVDMKYLKKQYSKFSRNIPLNSSANEIHRKPVRNKKRKSTQ
jgi:hypothetical protein